MAEARREEIECELRETHGQHSAQQVTETGWVPRKKARQSVAEDVSVAQQLELDTRRQMSKAREGQPPNPFFT